MTLGGCGGDDGAADDLPTKAEAAQLMLDALNQTESASVTVTSDSGTATFEGQTDWSNARLVDGDGTVVWLRVAGVDYAPADYCPDDVDQQSPACTDASLQGKFYSTGQETGSDQGKTMFSDLLTNENLVELSTSEDPVTTDGDTWVLADDDFKLAISAEEPHYPSTVWLAEASTGTGESTTTFGDFNQVPLFEAPTAEQVLPPPD